MNAINLPVRIRQSIVIPRRTLTGVIEVNELDGENVADYKVVVLIVIEGNIACSHKIQKPLLTHEPLCPDKKFNDHIFPDVLGQYELHGAFHLGRIKGLLGRRGEFGNCAALSVVRSVWNRVVHHRLPFKIKSCVGICLGWVVEAVVSYTYDKFPHIGGEILSAAWGKGVEIPKGKA